MTRALTSLYDDVMTNEESISGPSKVVWVVASGAYSDYRVLCACPSEADADTVAAKLRGDTEGWHQDARVESLPLVPGDVEKISALSLQVNVWDDGTTGDEIESVRSEWPFDQPYELSASWSWPWVRAGVHQGTGR